MSAAESEPTTIADETVEAIRSAPGVRRVVPKYSETEDMDWLRVWVHPKYGTSAIYNAEGRPFGLHITNASVDDDGLVVHLVPKTGASAL